MMTKPQTLQQAIVYFADKDIAHQYLVDLRWSDGVVCPHCGGLYSSDMSVAWQIVKRINAMDNVNIKYAFEKNVQAILGNLWIVTELSPLVICQAALITFTGMKDNEGMKE